MARHAPKWRCVLCNRVRVPTKGCVCHRCAATLPWLGDRPRWRERVWSQDRDDDVARTAPIPDTDPREAELLAAIRARLRLAGRRERSES